jgi:non-homologous end joining protein Ku
VEPSPPVRLESASVATQQAGPVVRKLIDFDDDTFDKLKQLARDRMATIQELADEAFADVLRKHHIPIDLKDALRKSAAQTPVQKSDVKKPSKKTAGSTPPRSLPSKRKKS